MINYVHCTIIQGDAAEPIARWEVWFRTPLGLCRTLDEAKAACATHEMAAQFSIMPVPVAVTATLYEEVPR